MIQKTTPYKNYKKYVDQRGEVLRLHPRKKVYIPFLIAECGTYLWNDIRNMMFALPGWKDVVKKYGVEEKSTPEPFYDFLSLFIKNATLYSDYRTKQTLFQSRIERIKMEEEVWNLSNALINLFFYLKEHYPYYFSKEFVFYFDINFYFRKLTFYDILAGEDLRNKTNDTFQKMLSKGYTVHLSKMKPQSREDYLCLRYAEYMEAIMARDEFKQEMDMKGSGNLFYLIDGFKWGLINRKDEVEFVVLVR